MAGIVLHHALILDARRWLQRRHPKLNQHTVARFFFWRVSSPSIWLISCWTTQGRRNTTSYPTDILRPSFLFDTVDAILRVYTSQKI